DGALELGAKAELLERRAAAADSLITDLDERIARLQAQLRRERSAEHFLAGVDRFDDTRVPVGPPGSAGAPGVGAASGRGSAAPAGDSAVVAPQDLPLDQQIEQLQVFRAQVVLARNQFVGRARLFRDRLRRSGE